MTVPFPAHLELPLYPPATAPPFPSPMLHRAAETCSPDFREKEAVHSFFSTVTPNSVHSELVDLATLQASVGPVSLKRLEFRPQQGCSLMQLGVGGCEFKFGDKV